MQEMVAPFTNGLAVEHCYFLTLDANKCELRQVQNKGDVPLGSR
jgi:hypothetical protein